MRKLQSAILILLLGVSLAPSAATTPLAAAPAAVLASRAQAGAEDASQQAALEGLEEHITALMADWKVPGLAIAVVKDGEVILAQGYGYRDAEQKLPVTPRTLFAIGSISKSFTATVLGMLADEGKIAWDEPVRTYLPDFRLYDRVATEQMTPRDLVSHVSGLPRHDLLWYGSDLTREQMYERLRYLQPSKEFRGTWQYQNLMFMTAGYLAGQASGLTWEELVRQRIFKPLGMARSNFSVRKMQQADDFALPYTKNEDEVKRVPYRNIDEIGPAGSINSSVDEMIRYVRLHINKGKHTDQQLLSEGNAQQMQTPQAVIPGSIDYDELGHNSYGLALFISTYRGHKFVGHGGGIDGFISQLSFLPRKKMGMIVLTNMSGFNPVPVIVTRNVYDRLLGLDQVDWSSRIREQREKSQQAEEEAKKKGYTARKEGTSPTHTLTDYAGNYRHAGYGEVQIELSESALRLRFHSFIAPLEHFHYDIFEVPEDSSEGSNPLEGRKVTFLYNKKGDIDRVALPLETNVADIVFERAANESMKQRSFLEPFVGHYELGPTTVSVALKGENTLTLTVPGQPTYDLVPARGTSFDVQGLNGFSVEFKQDAGGTVAEAVFYQPNGTFVAKRK